MKVLPRQRKNLDISRSGLTFCNRIGIGKPSSFNDFPKDGLFIFTAIDLFFPQLGNKQNLCDMINAAEQNAANNAALTKSISTPASLQTCVKFNGSNMTLQHRVSYTVLKVALLLREKLELFIFLDR